VDLIVALFGFTLVAVVMYQNRAEADKKIRNLQERIDTLEEKLNDLGG